MPEPVPGPAAGHCRSPESERLQRGHVGLLWRSSIKTPEMDNSTADRLIRCQRCLEEPLEGPPVVRDGCENAHRPCARRILRERQGCSVLLALANSAHSASPTPPLSAKISQSFGLADADGCETPGSGALSRTFLGLPLELVEPVVQILFDRPPRIVPQDSKRSPRISTATLAAPPHPAAARLP